MKELYEIHESSQLVVMPNSKVSIKGERKIFTFARLTNGAYFELENSKKYEESKSYNCVS